MSLPAGHGQVLSVALLGACAVALAVAAACDLRRRIVPNGCCVAVALTGAARALVASGAPGLAAAAAGGALVMAVMLATALASARATGASGVGGGDVKLLAAAGVWCGPVTGLAVVGASCAVSLVGWAIARVPRVLGGRGAVAPGGGATVRGIPLAPGICVSTLAAVLLGGGVA